VRDLVNAGGPHDCERLRGKVEMEVCVQGLEGWVRRRIDFEVWR
jgi:hypothetical protein